MKRDPRTFAEIIKMFVDIINSLLPVVAGLALLVFFWGLAKFISKSGDAKNHGEGKSLMIWGLIALFIMISFVGIINLAQSDLFGRPLGFPKLPTNLK